MTCDAPSMALAMAAAEAALATLAAIVSLYLFAWWRARANHLARQLRDEREANLLHNHRHRRDPQPGRAGDITTPG